MRFMVSFTYVQNQQDAIVALIPAEQAHVKALMGQGVIEALYLSSDRGWLVIKGESPEQVQEIMESFPLHPYLVMQISQLR